MSATYENLTTKVRLNGRESKAFNIKVGFGSQFTAVHHRVRRLCLENSRKVCLCFKQIILFDGRNGGMVTGKVEEVGEGDGSEGSSSKFW